MKRILFVTNRNILTTCGELRLIKNRAEVLYAKYGIATDFIAWNNIKRIKSNKREEIKAGGTISTLELSMMNPIQVARSFRALKKMIQDKLQIEEYSGIILSGMGMPSLVGWLKKEFSVSLYIDIHGAFEDILEVAKRNNIIKQMLFRILYQFDKRVTLAGIQNSDGVLVVTDALKNYLKEMYYSKKEIDYFIVPCAPDMKLVTQNEFEVDRNNYRKKYGINSNEIVFIYSGGISSWQCVQESIELYRRIAKKVDNPTRMLIFSQNINAIKKMVKNDGENIIIDSYSPTELMHALKAGDFAFLLRKNNVTNNVAFPNKFLEYVQSGMLIITTPYVCEIARQIQKFKLGYIWDFNDDISALIDYINKAPINVDRHGLIEKVLAINDFSKTLSKFAESLIND